MFIFPSNTIPNGPFANECTKNNAQSICATHLRCFQSPSIFKWPWILWDCCPIRSLYHDWEFTSFFLWKNQVMEYSTEIWCSISIASPFRVFKSRVIPRASVNLTTFMSMFHSVYVSLCACIGYQCYFNHEQNVLCCVTWKNETFLWQFTAVVFKIFLQFFFFNQLSHQLMNLAKHKFWSKIYQQPIFCLYLIHVLILEK